MKVVFVYKILPALVFYTNDIKDGFGGMANGPVVRIRKKYEDVDKGLLEHELTHVRQWYRTLGIHSIWYLFNKKYRLTSEVEAYKIQASYYNYDATGWMAEAIVAKYNLDHIGRNEVLAMLKP